MLLYESPHLVVSESHFTKVKTCDAYLDRMTQKSAVYLQLMSATNFSGIAHRSVLEDDLAYLVKPSKQEEQLVHSDGLRVVWWVKLMSDSQCSSSV